MNLTRLTSSSLVVAFSVALAACGGGGGSSEPVASTAGTPPAAVVVVSASGSLNAAAAAPSYAASSVHASAFAKLNELRKAAGAGELEQVATLDVAAGAHASYLSINQTVSHDQDASRTGFYAATPGARATKAGYTGLAVGEDIGGTGASRSGADCSLGLLNTVYHADSLLYVWNDVGVGVALDAAGFPMCVFNTGLKTTYGQVRPAGSVMAYPYAGQTGVEGTFYIGYEVPRPLPSEITSLTAGSPVLVSIKNTDFENLKAAGTLDAHLTKFELRDAGGNLVPAVVMVGPKVQAAAGIAVVQDPMLNEGSVVLVPRAALSPATAYGVTLSATLNAATSVSKTWTFSTR
ncbi:MAG TPA: CAP domain-containing protein [Methylibium sp.]|uniref:CAP domain-containing protein n=1 Tax=Methylibium sp. TaxID=2067992 RepID=UPI002DBF398A|nr:CAP domain-containing protein [Methylibium sp.]HEU4460871.1 CAP domain-containing protein [Methylibium sp.]